VDSKYFNTRLLTSRVQCMYHTIRIRGYLLLQKLKIKI